MNHPALIGAALPDGHGRRAAHRADRSASLRQGGAAAQTAVHRTPLRDRLLRERRAALRQERQG